MDFVITDHELEAMYGLPHIQQLAYLRGIRPYMDVKTGLVGIKRGISYQSIAEQLYIEPHQGIKYENYSRSQVRRALSGLERAGLIQFQSSTLKLILKCNLASRPYSVQNKAVTNPSQQAVLEALLQHVDFDNHLLQLTNKPDMVKTAKADTPLKDNNYIYLLSQFEKFWNLYPEKKSKQTALNAFLALNPDDALLTKILNAIVAYTQHREAQQTHGLWAPPWKYPANWLTQRCWEDEFKMDKIQETQHAKRRENTGAKSTDDPFWISEEPIKSECCCKDPYLSSPLNNY